jgi:hypothetical protein
MNYLIEPLDFLTSPIDYIKEAYKYVNKRISREQCGWQFEPGIELNTSIIIEQPFKYPCDECNVITELSSLEQYCNNCYNSIYYNKYDILENKIKNFNIDILDFKNANYLNRSIIYKARVEEFYALIFCGVEEEPNEWSSSPHDYYCHHTYLFINEADCDKQFQTLDILQKYHG